MKAVISTKYGVTDALQVNEIEKPTPKDSDVLIKIAATTVSSGDLRIQSFDVPPLFWLPFRLAIGLRKPRKILGMAFSGEVVEVGKNVALYKEGDLVFGSTEFNMGCYAEYACIPEKSPMAIKPDQKTHEEAAAFFFGANTALSFLKKGHISKGQKILIYGASGSVGTAAVQLAKYLGAEVTAVCSSNNLDLVKSLGADKTIDYAKTDFTQNGETYDAVFDTVGKSPFSGSVKSLKKNGFYLRGVHLTFLSILMGYWTRLTSSKKVVGGVATTKPEDLKFLRELFMSEKFTPVIDKSYSLEKIADAFCYVAKGHKKGNVVLTVDQHGS